MINFYNLHNKKLDYHSKYSEQLSMFLNLKYKGFYADNITITHIIMKDPGSAYLYADYTLYDRWPEAEPYIMQNPDLAYWYARNVIKGRWEEAEHVIMNNGFNWPAYCKEMGI